ncbi:ABC transporter permease [Algicola sagamiensis]|uniref:ABC transporter permease n=1 Tax=Algicola sagamiensis TaxID=163869 RepID=UPI0003657092|nr:ABC transporter permease [Algicola sagamiensis]
MNQSMPNWVNYALIPVINVLLAFLVSAIVFVMIDINPIEAAEVMIKGAFGSEGLGYTLYYTTNLIFTGLAVSVAFHAGLFNIGGEGQAYLGGLGVVLVCLGFGDQLPLFILMPLCILGAAFFGAAWAFIPAYLQAKRGSHIVITTIMFNFLASSLMVYLLVNVMKDPRQMAPVSSAIPEASQLPSFQDMMAAIGVSIGSSPLNLSFFFALIACVLVWIYVWHTRWGYELRSVGFNRNAAQYAGISHVKVIVVTMMISGALSGMMGINEVQGVSHQLKLDFVAGYGFTGIAVALMGRNHPIGVILASLLFGGLYQGGSDLAFDFENVDREIVVVIQGLVILFSGALEHMLRPQIVKIPMLYAKLRASNNQNGSAEA